MRLEVYKITARLQDSTIVEDDPIIVESIQEFLDLQGSFILKPEKGKGCWMDAQIVTLAPLLDPGGVRIQ